MDHSDEGHDVEDRQAGGALDVGPIGWHVGALEHDRPDLGMLGDEPPGHAHVLLTRRVLDGLRAHGAGEIKVVVGGIIPPRDVEELKKLGVAQVFPMGTPLPEIVTAFTKEAGTR